MTVGRAPGGREPGDRTSGVRGYSGVVNGSRVTVDGVTVGRVTVETGANEVVIA